MKGIPGASYTKSITDEGGLNVLNINKTLTTNTIYNVDIL